MLAGSFRSGDATALPPPFLSREAFRLVVLLEAQKANAVDVAALEQKFRVPPGYGDEDSDSRGRSRGRLAMSNAPGPGTYDAPQRWPPALTKSCTPPGVGFLSKTKRASSASTRRPSMSREATVPGLSADAKQSVMARPSCAQVGSPGRSFPRAQRWPSATERPPLKCLDNGNTEAVDGMVDVDAATPLKRKTARSRRDEELSTSYSSFRPSSAVSFRRSPRIMAPSPSPLAGAAVPGAPGVGAYEVKRFLDSNDQEQAKGFGAAKEKRRVMWGPTYTAPSSAVPTAWNSSRHYAKQKKKIEGMVAKQRSASKSSSSAQLLPTQHPLKPSASSPALPVARSLPLMAGTRDTSALDNDPFAWLRQQPNGDQRANFLATKFGLTDLVKQPTASSAAQNRRNPTVNTAASAACDNDHSEPDTKVKGDEIGGESIAAATTMPQLQRQQSFSDMRGGGDLSGSAHVLVYQQMAQRGQRLAVSCRLPGGMVLTVHAYSRGKLRGLKTAIMRRCPQRFASESDFDVFSLGGRLLGNLDATLTDIGLAAGGSNASINSSGSIMVQIVPRQHPPATLDNQVGGKM